MLPILQRLLHFIPTLVFPLNVLLLRIYLGEPHLDLLICCKHQSSGYNQSRQTGQRTAPERKHTFLLEDARSALEAVSVRRARFDTLHSCLDCVERLGNVDGDETCQTTNGKSSHYAELLAWCRVRLGHLLEEVVGGKTGCAVGGLSGCRGCEALEETSEATLAGDDGDGVEETAHSRLGRLAVVDTWPC